MAKKVFLIFASDFGPLLIFFLSFYLLDFMKATIALVVATTMVGIVSLVVENRIVWFPIAITTSIIVSGLLTVALHNPQYIIIENSVYNLLVGCAILILQKKGNDPIRKIFKDVIAISDEGWKITTSRWGHFMLASAVINEIIRIVYSPDAWVFYRFMYLWLLVAFTLWQIYTARRYRTDKANRWGVRIASDN